MISSNIRIWILPIKLISKRQERAYGLCRPRKNLSPFTFERNFWPVLQSSDRHNDSSIRLLKCQSKKMTLLLWQEE